MGDLGNIEANYEGVAELNIVDDIVSLFPGGTDIFRRSVTPDTDIFRRSVTPDTDILLFISSFSRVGTENQVGTCVLMYQFFYKLSFRLRFCVINSLMMMMMMMT